MSRGQKSRRLFDESAQSNEFAAGGRGDSRAGHEGYGRRITLLLSPGQVPEGASISLFIRRTVSNRFLIIS